MKLIWLVVEWRENINNISTKYYIKEIIYLARKNIINEKMLKYRCDMLM